MANFSCPTLWVHRFHWEFMRPLLFNVCTECLAIFPLPGRKKLEFCHLVNVFGSKFLSPFPEKNLGWISSLRQFSGQLSSRFLGFLEENCLDLVSSFGLPPSAMEVLLNWFSTFHPIINFICTMSRSERALRDCDDKKKPPWRGLMGGTRICSGFELE